MVRFVTTEYTHMYENSYIGLPGEKYGHQPEKTLTDVGLRVEKWRKAAGLKDAEVVKKANKSLPKGEWLNMDDYCLFLRGLKDLTRSQIRAMASVFDVSVQVMDSCSPGQVPKDRRSVPEKSAAIVMNEPSRHAKQKRKAQVSSKAKKVVKPVSKPAAKPRPYDADEAARLFSSKFRGKVRRFKSD